VLHRGLQDHLGRFGSDASGAELQEPSPESDANRAPSFAHAPTDSLRPWNFISDLCPYLLSFRMPLSGCVHVPTFPQGTAPRVKIRNLLKGFCLCGCVPYVSLFAHPCATGCVPPFYVAFHLPPQPPRQSTNQCGGRLDLAPLRFPRLSSGHALAAFTSSLNSNRGATCLADTPANQRLRRGAAPQRMYLEGYGRSRCTLALLSAGQVSVYSFDRPSFLPDLISTYPARCSRCIA